MAYLLLTCIFIGFAFVFSPYKPWVMFPEKVEEEVADDDELEKSLLVEDEETVVEYDSAGGPYDVESMALARGPRPESGLEGSPFQPNKLERIPESPYEGGTQED